MRIFRCIQSDWVSQGFYDNFACTKVNADGKPLYPYQVLSGTYPGTCPAGSVKLYPLFGLKAHGGVDRVSYYKEPGYFDAESPDVFWDQYLEIDGSGGLGIDVVSDRNFVLCTEKVNPCPPDTCHYVKRRYWHNIAAVVLDEEWSYIKCKEYIAGRERALVRKNVKLGDGIFLADSTGVSGGNHVHEALKWCDADGDGIHTDNGYYGAFDFDQYFENKFVIDIIKERRAQEFRAMEIVRLEAQIRASQLTLLQLLSMWVLRLQEQINKIAAGLGIGKGRGMGTSENMSNVFNWLVRSSADSSRISLTIKAAAPFVLAVAAFLKLDLVEGDLDQLAEAVASIVAGAFFVYGLVRKIVLSFGKKEGEVN